MSKYQITEKEWEAKGVELFGDDDSKWEFKCCMCENVMSIEIAKDRFPEVKGKGWGPAQECIGRYTDKDGCDWCSYGLFRGPVFIITKKSVQEIPVFDFNGEPFTGKDEAD